jgi:DNA primase
VPAEIIEDVRNRTDIVQVISGYVTLQRRGKNYLGLCPFHAEKTPSFTVNPEKGIFYCFGCQTGGSVFNFLMLREGLSFPEVLRTLAERAGVTLPGPEDTPEQRRRSAERERVQQALELATTFYEEALQAEGGAAARQYLARRGVAEGTIRRFRLGYSPPGWTPLLDEFRRRRFTAAELDKAGLVVARDAGHYDRFRERLMFPITNPSGKVVGFGARALGAEEPKYLNSPETPVFSKGRLLYGYQMAREGIRTRGQALLVEGYMDVIACHQAGLTHAVASLGTAFTRDQARLILQLAGTAVLAYDADAGGTSATARGLAILREVGCGVRVAMLPEGRDPDDCLREMGREQFESLLGKALPLPEYHFHLAQRDADLNTVEGKVSVSKAMLPVLAALDNEVEREAYLERFARALGVEIGALTEDLVRYQRQAKRAGDSRPIAGDATGRERQQADHGLRRAAEELLWAMATDPGLARRVNAELGGELLPDPAYREIAAGLVKAAEGPGFTPAQLVETLEDPRARALAAGLWLHERPVSQAERVAADCLQRLREHRLRQRLDHLQGEIRECEAKREGIRPGLLEEYLALIKELKEQPTGPGSQHSGEQRAGSEKRGGQATHPAR